MIQLSKEFYELICEKVNDGCLTTTFEQAFGDKRSLLVIGSKNVDAFELSMGRIHSLNNNIKVSVIAQPDTALMLKDAKTAYSNRIYEWRGRYTTDIVGYALEMGTVDAFDSFLYFYNDPADLRNMNLFEIGSCIQSNSINGRGIYDYVHAEDKLIEYDNVHQMYSAMGVYKYINLFLETIP